MQVWTVHYTPDWITEELYQAGLLLVDPESSARIKRFYRREDACRTLIGRLMPRVLLKKEGIPLNSMTFAATEAGKPYITTPGIDPPLAYNVSHDNALIAMVYADGEHNPPAFSLGVDVMKVRLPGRESYLSFVHTFGDQLTSSEKRLLLSVPQEEGLKRFFWMWTMKEAYTKALGIGLGFDFCRVEFDVESDVVRIDGVIPRGWRFSKFDWKNGDDLYQGVVAEFLGGEEMSVVSSEVGLHPWLHVFDAASFIQRAIQELPS